MRHISKQSAHERARRLGVRCSWLLAGWLSAASGQALSEGRGAATDSATVGGASPATSSAATEKAAETREQALQLVTAADRAFRGGDPAGSIPLLEEAYRIGGWPGCLLNLAMAHHALSRCEAALEYYRHYLSLDPYTDRRDEVIGALNELEGICGAPGEAAALGPARHADGVIPPAGESRAAPAVAAVEPRWAADPPLSARAPEAVHPPRTLEYALLGAGALSGVAAVVFTLASQRKEREAERFDTFSEGDSRARDIHETGVLYNRLSWGFGLGAAVLVGSGTTLWLMHVPGSSSIGLGAGSFPSVRYQGRF